MNVYFGPQLPKEREAVGLFPRVSFRSCLRRWRLSRRLRNMNCLNLLGDWFWDGQPLQVHKLAQFTQLIYIPMEKGVKYAYMLHNFSLVIFCRLLNLLDLPSKLDTDDGLEEVVDDFDEVGGVDDETGLQVLPISKKRFLNSRVNNYIKSFFWRTFYQGLCRNPTAMIGEACSWKKMVENVQCTPFTDNKFTWMWVRGESILGCNPYPHTGPGWPSGTLEWNCKFLNSFIHYIAISALVKSVFTARTVFKEYSPARQYCCKSLILSMIYQIFILADNDNYL